MTMTATDIFNPATQPAWIGTLLSHAVTLGLTTTSWRPGDPERTILTIMSFALQRTDGLASLMSQGGFLDFAASGSVTFENPDGTSIVVPVSPDPSDPEQNPTGAVTYLDALCEQNFNTPRIRSSTAGGELAVWNTSASTYPFAAGAYHVTDPHNAAAYSNTEAISITPSATIGTVSAVVTSSGLIRVTTAAAHGLTTGDAVAIEGVGGITQLVDPSAWCVTVVDTTKFTLDGSTFSGTYTSGGTVYEPTIITVAADVAGSASSSVNADGVVDVHTVTQAVTSLVGVSVDNLEIFEGADTENNLALRDRARLKLQSVSVNGPQGAYEFFALSASVYAPLLDPPRTMATPITRVLAFVGADGKVYVFLANVAGAPSAADITTINLVYAANCVPLGVVTVVAGATEVNVAIVADIWLPSAYATDANEAMFQTALQDYIQALKIGGLSDPAGSPAYTNKLLLVDVIGAVYEAAKDAGIPQLDRVTLTLDGAALDISLPVSTSVASVAKLVPAVPTVTLHPT